ncbi:exo-beta-N-acetylmuramidase NamZ domain-containing protein [Leeuwenhoekiella sp. NPDC079379]|uniref:exo-beta-N-acetylmuramidase NamZ family protein n=1 Tax=Leeuwenhoekiella sp. NPDC079379 TaxID=3364122 RepID=UPI0037C64A2C
MAFYSLKNTLFLVFVFAISCGNGQQSKTNTTPIELENTAMPALTTLAPTETPKLILGANRTETYLPLLENKRIAIVGNPSSLILKREKVDGTKTYTHLVDSLVSLNQNIIKVFSPEHGFRGTADAGEAVKDGKDPKTGLEVVSLYGNNKKPKPEQLEDIDILVFDIQDVGVRFYTYIATLHYVLEAAADAGIEVLVLDRPNPNGSYVDGPVMEEAHTSFLGMHAGVPLVHGVTIGEYATMMTQEGWLKTTKPVKLTVIPMQNYNHSLPYSLPVRPSPNLPNDQSVMLYPSLGLCEGTALNAGRGTEMQFQIIGSPYLPASKYKFNYTPAPNFGSKSPKFNGEVCNGLDLRGISNLREVNLTYIIDAYTNYSKKEDFFNTANFTAHAGTAKLQKQIESGVSFSEIKAGWSQDLERFKQIRSKYLLYKE